MKPWKWIKDWWNAAPPPPDTRTRAESDHICAVCGRPLGVDLKDGHQVGMGDRYAKVIFGHMEFMEAWEDGPEGIHPARYANVASVYFHHRCYNKSMERSAIISETKT